MSDDATKEAIIDDITGGDTPPDITPKSPPPERDTPPPRRRSPKRRTPSGDTGSAPKPRVTRQPTIEKQLEEFFGVIAVAIGATGDMYCAGVVASQAKPLADAWGELARKNERVRAIIERMMEGSTWGGVIFATMVTVIPIAAHHGMYPKGMPMPFDFGVGPPPPVSDEVASEHQRQGNQGSPTPPA
jgi:hypothetical protein